MSVNKTDLLKMLSAHKTALTEAGSNTMQDITDIVNAETGQFQDPYEYEYEYEYE